MATKLRTKLVGLSLVPGCAILVLSIFIAHQATSLYLSADALEKNLVSVNKASALINELQKERGKSATFLNGGLGLDSVETQRRLTNQRLSDFRDAIPDSEFNAKTLGIIEQSLDLINPARSLVSSRGPLNEVLKSYTGIIAKLLDLYIISADASKIGRTGALIRSLSLLEAAKESSGKLRANMSSALAKDMPLTDERFNTIVNLKATMDANLSSTGLVLSERSIIDVNDFNTKSHWITVNEVFNLLLKKSDVGEFGRDGAEFFGVISKVVDDIGKIVRAELSYTNNIVSSAKTENMSIMISVIASVLVLAFLIAGMVISSFRSIVKPITASMTQLNTTTESAKAISEHLTASSQTLAEHATEQAASLEETAASIEEISAMVNNNLSNAETAENQSNKASKQALEGDVAMDEVLTSMKGISESNEEIAKLSDVIQNIGAKTDIMNEIVFQTKLLSFNASVEAERAGEHGRGFSVVAQEVGNLAEMTGKASSEIATIVKDSSRTADEIIRQCADRVESGRKKVEKMAAYLKEIINSCAEVTESSKQVVHASREQNEGIEQINIAMQQLDTVTQSNAATSEMTAAESRKLNMQSTELGDVVDGLSSIIFGSHYGGSVATVTTDKAKPQKVHYAKAKKPTITKKAPTAEPKQASDNDEWDSL